MRSLLASSLLWLGTGLHAADEPPATAGHESLPPTRYFLLVETSVSMKKQREVALDTVNRLLLGSVNGRIRTNDTLTICAYSDQLFTNLVNDEPWDPDGRVELANRVYRTLRDENASKKPKMDVAMDALKQATTGPGVVTAILVYSGSQPIDGTPYDNLVNEITGKHRDDMREAGKPFITTFVIRDGRFLGYGVTPGGRPIFIPPLPKPPPPPAPTNVPPAQTSAALTNKPRPMTVEEIEEALRKSRKPTNAPAPLTNLITSSTPATDGSTPSAGLTASEITNAATTIAASPTATPGVPAPASTNASSHVASSNPPAAAPPLASAPAGVSSHSNTPPRETIPASASAGTAPPPAHAVPRNVVATLPPPANRSWTDLATGVALLLAAAALSWVLIRNVRPRSHASVISRSMDAGRKS